MNARRGHAIPAEVGGRALRLLASVQALNHAGEACFAVSLAGSLFFAVSVDAARPLIILYLVVTMAPFAIVVPLIGPVIDRMRGGQRGVILASLLGRAGLFVLLSIHLEHLAFYPEAFAALVLAKTYLISRAAIVPRFEAEAVALVKANSRLAVAGAIGGTAGAAAGTALLMFANATWVLRAGAGILFAATAVASSLPATGVSAPVPSVEVPELRSPFIRAAAMATGALRLSVGFMTFYLAFALKRSGEPLWVFGFVLAAGAVGGFSGSISAPALRRRVGEDRIIAIGLAFPVVIAAVAALRFHVSSVMAVAASAGLAGAIARHGFDSLVQRQAPDVDRGRAFARFETQFQLAWVFGALIAVLARPSGWVGMLVLAAVLAYATAAYVWEVRTLGRAMATGGRSGLIGGLLESAQVCLLSGARRQAIVVAATAAEAAADLRSVAQEPPDLLELRHLRDGVVRDATEPPEARVERALALARRVVSDVSTSQLPS